MSVGSLNVKTTVGTSDPLSDILVTYEKVWGQGSHHKARERLLLLVADIAESGQVVCIHQSHYEDDDGLDGWDGPRCDVEVGAVHLNGLVAPLQSSSQEPGERQDHPPRRGRTQE